MDRVFLSELNDHTVKEIREMHYSGVPMEWFLSEYCTDAETITCILNGDVLPYAGGPLLPLPHIGLNGRNKNTTKNRLKFIRAAIGVAKKHLSEEEFERFANFNGMSKPHASLLAKSLEDLNETAAEKRYRNIFLRHEEGASIEDARSYRNR